MAQNSGNPRALVLPLSPFDQTIIRAYVRKLYCFRFPDSDQRERAVIALEYGITTTVKRWPFIAGDVGPNLEDTERNNTVKLQYVRPTGHYNTNHSSKVLKFRTLSHTEFPYSYQELCDKRMPPKLLKKELFSSVPQHPKPGETRSALAVQATFIDGGLFLCIASHHSVFDGTSVKLFLDSFARALKDRTDGFLYMNLVNSILPRIRYSNGTHCGILDVEGRSLKQFPEYRTIGKSIAPISTDHPPLKGNTACILVISAETAEKLKQGATRYLRTEESIIKGWISTTDCLSALIWVATVRARVARLNADEWVRFGFAVSVRERAKSLQVSSDYFGNAIVHQFAESRVSNIAPAAADPWSVFPKQKRNIITGARENVKIEIRGGKAWAVGSLDPALKEIALPADASAPSSDGSVGSSTSAPERPSTPVAEALYESEPVSSPADVDSAIGTASSPPVGEASDAARATTSAGVDDSAVDVETMQTGRTSISSDAKLAQPEETIPVLEISTLARMAFHIRRAIVAVDNRYVTKRLEKFSFLKDPTLVTERYKKALDMGRLGLDFSSWQEQGADLEFAIPGVKSEGRTPDFVRKTWSANAGSCNILPRKKDKEADWEILLGLEEGDMRRALAMLQKGGFLKDVVAEDAMGV